MVTGGQSGDKVTNESLCETIKVICAGHLSLYVRWARLRLEIMGIYCSLANAFSDFIFGGRHF